MDQLGKKAGARVQKACPTCGMVRAEWPDAGVAVNGTEYCCRGCADGTGCTCAARRLKTKPTSQRSTDL